MRNERILDLLYGWSSFYDETADCVEAEGIKEALSLVPGFREDAYRIAGLYQQAGGLILDPDFNMKTFLLEVILPELERE